MDPYTAEKVELQKQLTARSAMLSQLSARDSELADEFSRVESQTAAGATVLNNLMWVAPKGRRKKRPIAGKSVWLQSRRSSLTPRLLICDW